MATKVVFSAQMKELKIKSGECTPVFKGAKLREGTVHDLSKLVRQQSDLKITVEAVQPDFFDDGETPGPVEHDDDEDFE